MVCCWCCACSLRRSNNMKDLCACIFLAGCFWFGVTILFLAEGN